MPPHSSHLLQPLDVGCFAVLKRSYGRLVDQQTRMGINHIDKLDFFAAYPRAREDAFQTNTIQNAFKATGLIPLNAAEVLHKLNIQLRPPSPPDRPSSRSSIYCPQTPSNIKQLSKHRASAKRFIKYRSDSPPTPTREVYDQAYKACEKVMKRFLPLEQEVVDLHAANYTKKRKKSLSRKQIQRDEGFFVHEAHEQGIGRVGGVEVGWVLQHPPRGLQRPVIRPVDVNIHAAYAESLAIGLIIVQIGVKLKKKKKKAFWLLKFFMNIEISGWGGGFGGKYVSPRQKFELKIYLVVELRDCVLYGIWGVAE